LKEASAARVNGELERARRSESLAVALLERQRGERLSVEQRWSSRHASPIGAGPYLATTLDDQLQVLDARSGKLHARVPRPSELHGVELNASGERLLLRSIDLSAVRQPLPACISSLQLFDARTSKLLKRECAMPWAFSPDGSRLVVARLIGWGDGAIARVVVLDSQSLEPVFELPQTGNFDTLHITPDGTTLLARSARQVLVTDMRTGKTESFSGVKDELPSQLLASGQFAAWRFDHEALVWNNVSRRLTRFNLGPCAENRSDVVVSPSGARLAAECGDVVTIWQLPADPVRAPTRRQSFKAPAGSRLFSTQWLPGDRGLSVELSQDGRGRRVLYDTQLRRWLALGGPNDTIRSIDAASGLVVVERRQQASQLFHVDGTLRARLVTLPDCGVGDVVSTGESRAVVTCLAKDGAKLVVVDTKTLEIRSFAGSLCKPVVHGDTLISACDNELELRDLRTVALLPTSPTVPSATEFDGWWDGDDFISHVAFEDRRAQRVVRFGSALQSKTEDLPAQAPCSQHRGKAAWSSSAPYPICDRRTGAVIGRIPAAAVSQGRFDVPELSDDGRFVVSNDQTPLLAQVADARPISVIDLPRYLKFVGRDLLVGSGESSEWGFWSAATGQRLSRSTEQLSDTPLVADAALGIAIEAGRSPMIRDFSTGKKLESLALDRRGDLELSPRGVLSVVEPARVVFWQVPRARRLGVLLNHPKTGEVAFLTDKQGFELSGEPTQWRDLLRCQVGLDELPLEICLDAQLEPGLGARTLLGK
jgi:hypothetical protein